MTTSLLGQETPVKVTANGEAAPQMVEKVAVLTGGFDKPYALGLVMALACKGITLDVIGSDQVDSPEMHSTPGVRFLNLHGTREDAGLASKMLRVLLCYARLIWYAASSEAKIFHILWYNKFQYFDRTALMLYYKLLGKKIILTAHNVNAGVRDSNDSRINRATLRIQYRLADHIFLHTEKMKQELLRDFGVHERAATVIPFGINNTVPNTGLTGAEARRRLGIAESEKAILFFGAIRPYKGLEYLVEAFFRIAANEPQYRLIIAGAPRKDTEQYLADIERTIDNHPQGKRIIRRIQYVPDEETELYFKAADVLALPYTHVFQSGVLFLAFSFGLPVIATDVGSIGEDIIEGRAGLVCKARDPEGLAIALEKYFASDLFKNLDIQRKEIKDYANARHSWGLVGEITRDVYLDSLEVDG
jgi:glycosyltransferase involved in cell wall biosynthesis